jgi:hypothetical protein
MNQPSGPSQVRLEGGDQRIEARQLDMEWCRV